MIRRRRLILSALGAGGALIVGWAALPERSRLGGNDSLPARDGRVALNGWIGVAGDGTVQLVMARSEMGQGVHTALAMIVAEELELPLSAIRLEPAGRDSRYGNVAAAVDAVLFFGADDVEPGSESFALRSSRRLLAKAIREIGINATGGSSSITDLYPVLQLAAATARAQLLGAASLQWRLPVAELQLGDGIVSHPSGMQAHFGELARFAAATPPGRVRPKPRAAWRLLGTAAPRLDIAAKIDGSARFGIDVREPGQLFAAIVHAPQIGGSPGAVDIDSALRRPGVLRVVRLPPYDGAQSALAVVARTSWHALRAAREMRVEWRAPPHPVADSATIARSLDESARRAAGGDGGFAFADRGDARAALARSQRVLEAAYRVPYLAHAAMEPMNCTARVVDGRVQLWAPTQVPTLARAAAARVAGVDESAVDLEVTYLGGGFGRRLEVDFVAQAVRVALETGGAPVQLLWSREEDFAHDFYRPAAAALLRAALDENGRPSAIVAGIAGDTVQPRYLERVLPGLASAIELPDKTSAEGLFGMPYRLAHLRVVHRATRHGVPVGSWRSVGHSTNAFFAESFVDEMAHLAAIDPLAFRLSLLEGRPRHAAVLSLAAERAGWGRALPPRRARGIALHESFNSIVAMVVEVEADHRGRLRVPRVVAAIDCGSVVNPGIVAQQLESAVMFGLAAALHQRIEIVGGAVQQRNFGDYPLLTLADTPRIETHLVASERSPGGVGEPGLPPLAPALANAVFALTGVRHRALPLAAGGTERMKG